MGEKIRNSLAVLLLSALTLSGCHFENKTSDSTYESSLSSSYEAVSSSDFGENSSGLSSSESSSSSAFGESSSEFSSSSLENSSSSEVASSSTASGSVISEQTSSSSVNDKSSSSSSKSSSSKQPENQSSSSSSPPPQVVIPNIEVPTSPGTAVINATGAVVDYSNAGNGYISVKYTGSSKRVKFRYTFSDKTYTFDIPVDGTVVYLPLSCGSGSYTFSVFENIEGNTYSTLVKETVSINISSSTKPYTYPNQFVSYNKNSQCVKKAAELCAGMTGAIDKISAIFLYISDNVTYDYNLASTVKSGYIPNPDKTLSSKKGICFDYASLMSAMLRSQGIPTRLVVGYASPDIYHAWNEVYTEQTGWITPELLMNNKGYNIADATFYSSAKDKKTISDYIMNSTNYSAVYYY